MKPHRTLATAIAVVALAAPAAQAAPSIEPGSGVTGEPLAAEPPPITTTLDEGFDWGSAAIGAGGAGALIALISLGGFTYSSRGRTAVPR
jgi:hypothetical protein